MKNSTPHSSALAPSESEPGAVDQQPCGAQGEASEELPRKGPWLVATRICPRRSQGGYDDLGASHMLRLRGGEKLLSFAAATTRTWTWKRCYRGSSPSAARSAQQTSITPRTCPAVASCIRETLQARATTQPVQSSQTSRSPLRRRHACCTKAFAKPRGMLHAETSTASFATPCHHFQLDEEAT